MYTMPIDYSSTRKDYMVIDFGKEADGIVIFIVENSYL